MDSAFFGTLPQTSQGKTGEVAVTQLPEENEFIGLYFSAHWCPPCRQFTPMLAEFYKNVNKDKKQVEIIFVSSDHNQKDFDDYFATMPWIAVPFDSDNKELLGDQYGIQGIPTLLIFDKKGKLVDQAGRATVMQQNLKAIDRWKAKASA